MITKICKQCGVEFFHYPGKAPRYCSKKCAGVAARGVPKKRKPPEERFWAKVNKDGPIHESLGTPCWLWTRGLDHAGYGTFNAGGYNMPAHGWSYRAVTGAVPAGLHVLHRCRNRHCVNPDHLYAGTQKQNVQDMLRDGTATTGEKSPKAKLTEGDVRTIISDTRCGRLIAEEYGISTTHANRLKAGKRWVHLARGVNHEESPRLVQIAGVRKG